jgi:uncharacterized protein YqfB (UPF0267 family)
MELIKLKFTRALERKITNGQKTVTVRRARHGKPGDIFEVRGVRYKLQNITKMSLGDAGMWFYREDGCRNISEFKRVWTEIYHKWVPCQPVYLHRFKKL